MSKEDDAPFAPICPCRYEHRQELNDILYLHHKGITQLENLEVGSQSLQIDETPDDDPHKRVYRRFGDLRPYTWNATPFRELRTWDT